MGKKCDSVVCTDDDLKRLNSDVKFNSKLRKGETGPCPRLTLEKMKAFLARLEAGEKALAQTETFRIFAHNHLTICQSLRNCTRYGDKEAHIHACWEFGKALEAWRTAAGKREIWRRVGIDA